MTFIYLSYIVNYGSKCEAELIWRNVFLIFFGQSHMLPNHRATCSMYYLHHYNLYHVHCMFKLVPQM